MNRLMFGGGLLIGLGVAATAYSAAPQGAPLLNQYCVTCHNQKAKTAGLMLDTLDFENAGKDAATWEKVVRKIRTGMMPPSGARRPERSVLDQFASDLESRLDRASAANPNPGTKSLQRLNRTEYANVIRDLLAIDLDVTTLLPQDDATEGFDNIADALGVSPSFIQGYVSAAMKISRRAVGDRTLIPSQVTYFAPPGLLQDRHIDGLPLGTRGGMLIRHTFPLDAEYEFTIGGGIGGGGGGAATEVLVDGEKIPVANTRNFRLPIKAGPHTIAAALVDRQRAAGVDDAYSDFRVDSAFRPAGAITNILINGPFNSGGPGDTPSRRRILVCQPKTPGEEAPCARTVLRTLARRAFRRPVTDTEVDGLMVFYQQGRSGGDFELGIQHALARILVAPRFLYRLEEEPAGAGAYRLGDIALASRLSFFLWSSMPDDELLDLAARNRLSDPKILEQQVRRMLSDPKSDALIRNFAAQWLYLRELAKMEPIADHFDENLRQSFAKETEMLFESIVREDRSIVNLIESDYTFVDERLARHYGIPNIRGSYFRRITLDAASPRRGILGQGTFLSVTSVGSRTSPVSRGRWILENVLGTPAPVPPPGIDTNLEKNPEEVKVTSLRQRLELHRNNPACSSCHKIMDPLGLALENFDLVGMWREEDGKMKIDASGELVDGTPIKGPADLRRAVLSRSEAFVRTATEKLLMYALGRSLQHYDMPAVRQIVRDAAPKDYNFSSLVLGIVKSAPFQMKLRT